MVDRHTDQAHPQYTTMGVQWLYFGARREYGHSTSTIESFSIFHSQIRTKSGFSLGCKTIMGYNQLLIAICPWSLDLRKETVAHKQVDEEDDDDGHR